MTIDIETTLPEGFKRCSDIEQIKRLKKGKRTRTDSNLEIDVGRVVYIRSHITNIFYRKILENTIPTDTLQRYINFGLLYYMS